MPLSIRPASSPETWPAQTVPTVFRKTAKKFASQTAIRHYLPRKGISETAPYNEKFKEIAFTWNEYHQTSRNFAKSLINVGLNPQRAVTIQGSNSPHWLFANMGTLLAGGLSVGVYPTNGPELSQHAVKNSCADVVVVEDEKQLQKYIGLKETAIKCFVVWNQTIDPNIASQLNAPIYTWDDFIAKGESIPDSTLKGRIKEQKPDQICSLIYTSGTTDLPKAAALTHDNMIWTGEVTGSEFSLDHHHRTISYLPTSHIAAQMLDIIAPAIYGSSIDIAPNDALKGTNLKQHLVHASPTYFLAVPRVWEKFMEGMIESTKKLTGFKRILSQARQWLLHDIKTLSSNPNTLSRIHRIRQAIDQFFLDKINQRILNAIGLQKCKIAASGAGAIDPKVVDFFKDFGIKIIDLYGLSETSGPATLSKNGFKGSSGQALPGTQLIIAEQDEEGKGEIRIKGRHVFKEYWNNPEATKNTFDAEGFLRTGDEGRLDEEGNLFITGRLKELIKTSGGENIPPVRIEQRIKQELPIVY